MIKPHPPQNEDVVIPVHTNTTTCTSVENEENPLTTSTGRSGASIDISGSLSSHPVLQDLETDSSNEEEKEEEDIQLLQSRPIKFVLVFYY